MDNIWVMALLLTTCLCKCWKIKKPLWLTLKFNRVRRQRRLQSPCWKLTVRIRVRKKIVSFLASTSTAITNLNYSRRKMKPFWPKSSPLNQGTWLPGVRKQMKATQLLNRPWKLYPRLFIYFFFTLDFLGNTWGVHYTNDSTPKISFKYGAKLTSNFVSNVCLSKRASWR